MPTLKTATFASVALLTATLAACSGNSTFDPSGAFSGTGSSPLGPSSGSTTIIGSASSLAASTNSLTAATSSLRPMDTTGAGVQICVDGEATCTSLDDSGRFELEGDFSGDVALLVVGPDGPIAEFTILGVVEGETIVVRVELDDDSSHNEILSRSRNSSDDPSDDASSDDLSSDGSLSDDDSRDDISDDTSTDDVSDDDSSEDVSNDDVPSPSSV